MNFTKKLILLLTLPIRFTFSWLIRPIIKAIYSSEKTLKHDIKSDFRASILNGLHQTFVGKIPQPFLIHNKEITFSSDNSLMSVQSYYVGEVEYHQMNYLIKNHLSKGMTFLDVGGHHGAFAAIVGHELKKQKLGGIIFTFEPDNRNIKFIEQNLKANNLTDIVTIIPKAVSNQNGKGRFVTSSDNSCNWLEMGIETEEELKSTEIIEMISLDEFCKDFVKVDVIKIDIQGGELNALKGAEKIIQKFSPVLLVEIMDYSVDAKEAKVFLEKLGYSLHYLTKKSNLVSTGSSEIFISWDVIALPN